MAEDQPDLLAGSRRHRVTDAQAGADDPPGPARAVRPRRAEEVHDRRRTRGAGLRPVRAVHQGEPLMGYQATLRVWRGDAGSGSLADYQVEVNDGEVVLDVLH